jgi:hypothetical protein
LRCGFNLEAFAEIADYEMNPIGFPFWLHVDPVYFAVLCGIVHGFLYNAKKWKPDCNWHRVGDISAEVNLDSMALGEFLAPAPYARNNAKVLQL